jgi:hypothetical protein
MHTYSSTVTHQKTPTHVSFSEPLTWLSVGKTMKNAAAIVQEPPICTSEIALARACASVHNQRKEYTCINLKTNLYIIH